MTVLTRLRSRLLRARRHEPTEIPYKIGNHTITLPTTHPLPHFQEKFFLYDRFPLCVGSEDTNGWIIDVGANVGDSAAAFASGGPKRLLCIEPCKTYRAFLDRNRQAIEERGTQLVVVPYAVSGLYSELRLEMVSGSAKKTHSANHGVVTAYSLDYLALKYCASEKIAFIKCDVDGFDWDVLLSGKKTIARDKPSIYFECETSRSNVDHYLNLFRFLLQLEYNFCFFDNFGLPLLQTASIDAIRQLLAYTAAGKEGNSHQAIYYFDCFAHQISDRSSLNILSRYQRFIHIGSK